MNLSGKPNRFALNLIIYPAGGQYSLSSIEGPMLTKLPPAYGSERREGIRRKFDTCHRFQICALLEYKRDGRLGEMSTELAGSPIFQDNLAHFRILGLVLADLETFCIDEACLGHISM